MRRIEWRPRAVADLDGILAYLALELKSPQAARACSEAIMQAVERAAELPESGKLFMDDDLERPYRRVLAKNYWVFYAFDEETLTVWRIFHVRQDYEAYGFAFDESTR